MEFERNYFNFRTTWENTDGAGYIHNSVVFRYFDIGEVEWFRVLGIPWHKFPDLGFPRIHVEADFKKPLFFDDECVLETSVNQVKRGRIELRHRIFKQDEVAVIGKVVFCCTAKATGRPRPIPEIMRDLLSRRLPK